MDPLVGAAMAGEHVVNFVGQPGASSNIGRTFDWRVCFATGAGTEPDNCVRFYRRMYHGYWRLPQRPAGRKLEDDRDLWSRGGRSSGSDEGDVQFVHGDQQQRAVYRSILTPYAGQLLLGTRNYERAHSQSRLVETLVDQGLLGECCVMSVSCSRLFSGSGGSTGAAFSRNHELELIRWTVRHSISARDEHYYRIWIHRRMRDDNERISKCTPG